MDCNYCAGIRCGGQATRAIEYRNIHDHIIMIDFACSNVDVSFYDDPNWTRRDCSPEEFLVLSVHQT